MKKYLKILFTVTFMVIVTGIATLYFVTQKIEPESLKSFAISELEKNFPKAKLEIGAVEYEFGKEIIFSLNDIRLKIREGQEKLLHLDQLRVHLPIWAILTNGGTIDIRSNSLKLFYDEKEEKSNWSQIFNDKKAAVSEEKPKKQKVSLEIPGYFKNSKLNFKLKNSNFFINREGNDLNFKIESMYIKNLNFKGSTVLTLSSSLSYKTKDAKVFKTSVEAISEVNLQKLIEERILKISSNVRTKKTSLAGITKSLPSVKAKFSIQGLIEDFVVSASVKAGAILELESKININKKTISTRDLSISFAPGALLEIVNQKLPKLIELQDLDKERFQVQGGFIYSLESNTFDPNLSLTNKNTLSINIRDSVLTLKPKIKADLIGEKATASILSPFLKGQLAINSVTDIKTLKTNLDLNLNDIDLTKKELNKLLYSDDKKDAPANENMIEQKVEKNYSQHFPLTSLTIKGRNNTVDGQKISIDSLITLKGNSITFKKIDLESNKGLIRLEGDSQFNKREILSKVKVIFEKSKAETFRGFLPAYFESLQGIVNGTVSGDIRTSSHLKYSFDVDAKVVDGEFKNLNLMKFLDPMLSEIKLLKGKLPKDYKVTDKFNELYVKTHASETNNVFKELIVVTGGRQFRTTASGNISMIDKESVMKGSLVLVKSKLTIPFLLRGDGFALKPELKYTTDKMATQVYKSEKKKVERKIKKKIDNTKEDLKRKLEEELKKKFKGFSL